MHAHSAINIRCRGATLFTKSAARAWQTGSPQLCSCVSAKIPHYLPTRRSSASGLVVVSRATVSNNGSGYPRQTVTSDRDGTLGTQSRVPADDVVASTGLSSASRPPLLPSVQRSYEVPLWGRSSYRAPLATCKVNVRSCRILQAQAYICYG